MATMTKSGAVIAQPVKDAVIAALRENAIGLMIVDPFIASHGVTENDNPAMEAVTSCWGEIADVADAAVELVHHARKTGGAEVTVEDGRGASAVLAKTRAARTLNVMTEDEAVKAGVGEHRAFFRVQSGKSNNAPPSSAAEWYQILSVNLGNGSPGIAGDSVGVVTPWSWPDSFEGVSADDLRSCQSAINEGRWRANPQAKSWAGIAIARVLKLDPADKAVKARIIRLLKAWTATGMFVCVEGEDDQRKKRTFIEVGERANDN